MDQARIVEAVNIQLNKEYYSAFLYLSISAYFSDQGLPGFSNWMRVQYQEELTHGDRIADYILSRGFRMKIGPIEGPPHKWPSALNAAESAHSHEQAVTSAINDLVGLAEEEKDRATANFLMWFVNEQIEEESSTLEIVSKLKLVGEAGEGLFMLDNEMAKRVFVPLV